MKRYLIILSIACFEAFGQNTSPIFHLTFNEESGDSQAVESITSSILTIQNNFNRPERIEALSGNALRLDGWSTFIQAAHQLGTIEKTLSVEVWYATESFSPSTDGNRQPIPGAALINQLDNQSGFSLGIGSYGNIEFEFWLDDQAYSLETSKRISTYEWHHIVATIDLEAGTARIYIDGELSIDYTLGVHSEIAISDTDLLIGRHSFTALIAGLNVTTLNGAIDELLVFNESLTQEQIVARYEANLPLGEPNLFIDPAIRHAGDALRPQYHLMPNTSWANEGYGFTYYEGKYHYFFQKNPNAPFLHFMHWGHMSSPDLVDWTEEKMVMAPDPGWDDFGIWSGTTIKDPDGVPVIYYTGVDRGKAGIGMAYPNDVDLIGWEKFDQNPVIAERPPAFEDFRDPYVWQEGDKYYMIVGGARSGKGALPTYESDDMISWSTTTTLFVGSDPDIDGRYWEMPYFIKLNEDGDYLLGVGPLFENKKAQAIYWIGSWDNGDFHPYFEEPKQLEFARDQMLAPAFGRDEEGRLIYIGIVPDTRPGESQIAAGWRQTFTIPRVVRLMSDSTLGTYAHPNLCRYRGVETSVTDRAITFGTNFNLPEFGGNQIELLFKLLAEDSAVFDIQVLKSEDGSQFTGFEFDLEKNTILADRRFSSSEPADATAKRGEYVFDSNDTIYVHAFIDRSIVEVFVDNTIAYSGRIYPDQTSLAVDLIVKERSVNIVEAYQWERLSFGSEAGNEVCEPSFVPDKLRDPPVPPETPLGIRLNDPNIFPNPADDSIWIDCMSCEDFEIQILDMTGKPAYSSLLTTSKLNRLDVSRIPQGIYVLEVQSPNKRIVQRIIIEH